MTLLVRLPLGLLSITGETVTVCGGERGQCVGGRGDSVWGGGDK